MLDMNEICQKWLSTHKKNITAIFANEDIEVGCVRDESISFIQHFRENAFIMTWILEDRGTFDSNGKQYSIHPECVNIRRPRQAYKLSFDDRFPHHRYFIRLPICLYDFLVQMYPQLDSMPPVIDAPYNAVIHQRFIQLLETTVATPASSLHWLIPDLFSLVLDITALAVPTEYKQLAQGKSLLEKTANEMSLEEIANACGLSYGTFRKSFRRMYGISPGQYRIEYRIHVAKRLLKDGSSVSKVAQMLNYPDIYTFSHQFREVVQCSPTEYVQQKQRERAQGLEKLANL